METIKNDEELQTAIFMLEARKEHEAQLMKKQFREVVECLRPINIIKNTIRDAASSPGIKGNLISSAIGMGTGFLANKFIVGKSGGLIKKLVGTLVAKVLSKKVTETVIDKVGETKSNEPGLLQKIFSKPLNSPETS